MTAAQAQREAEKILGHDAVTLKRNGVCRIVRGGVLLAAAPSWLAALRYAAKPVLEERQKEEAAARVERQKQLDELAKESAEFADFLREKFDAEFAVWRARDGQADSQSPAGDAG